MKRLIYYLTLTNYFINKFKAIPTDMYISGERDNGMGQHCAHGWCDTGAKQIVKAYLSIYTKEEYRFKNLAEFADDNNLMTHVIDYNFPEEHGFALVNNGDDPMYQQKTEKERILACLNNVKQHIENELVGDISISQLDQKITKAITPLNAR